MSIRKLPVHILENILFMTGYYESLVLLGSRIYADSRFQKFLLYEGGPGRILETTILRGADIPTLLLLKPLMPSYIALALSIKVTKKIPTIKRICIIWDIYHCDLAYSISCAENFGWGVENLHDNIPYDPHQVNRAYAASRQFEKIDFTINDPLKDVAIDMWLYEKLGKQVLNRLSVYKLCMLTDIESDVLYDYVCRKLVFDTERIENFQTMIEGMIYGKRFKEAKQLYETFEAEYKINSQVIENDLLEMGRDMLEDSDPKKTEYIQLLEYFGYPEASVYRAILFVDAEECLRFLRSDINFMLESMICLQSYELLRCQGFLDQLTDEEFDAVSFALFEETIPRSIDESSSQADIRAFYNAASIERKLELIRSGIMTDWKHVTKRFLVRDLNEQANPVTFLQAITETHGMDLLLALEFHLTACSKKDFSWLAKALVDTQYDGVAREFLVFHATVSKGTVHYLDFRRLEQGISWKRWCTNNYFTELLIQQVAFWNYYEDELMFI